jgi:choice-of-anchor A domain-containing protein
MPRRTPLSLSLAIAAGALVLVVSPFLHAGTASAVGSATNPFAPLAGFTILTNGDTTLGNTEIEGTAAIGGDLVASHGYNFIHTSGFTPAGYALPVVDGDPTRLLIAGEFDTTASAGVSEVSSRGNIRPDQLGYLKIGDTGNLSLAPRGNQGLGVWASATGTTAGSEPALYVTDTVAEPQSSVAAPNAYSDLFGTAFASLTGSGTTLLSLTSCAAAHETTLASAASSGARTITLVPGVTNFLDVTAADLAFDTITFVGAQPGPDTAVVFNLTGSPTEVTLPRFEAASSSSASDPNPVAPYVLWNLTGATSPVTVHGTKISGSILAPRNTVMLDASSPVEGQIAAARLTTAGGEIHHYAFASAIGCLSSAITPVVTPPTSTPAPTAPGSTPVPTVSPTGTPAPTSPTTDSPAPSTPTSTSSAPAGPATGAKSPAQTAASATAPIETDSLAHTGSSIDAWVTTGIAAVVVGIALTLIRVRSQKKRARG